jgi:predicted phosphodiesterase
MEAITKIIPKTYHYDIVPLGDVQYGNINTDIDKFKETIKYIKNKPDCYTILMGDMCEGITVCDKRLDPLSITPHLRDRLDNIAMSEYEEMRNMLRPIRKKILCSIRGNHGETMRKYHGVDFDGWLCSELGITNAGYMALMRVSIKDVHAPPVTMFLQHGFSASRKKGAKVNAIEDLAAGWEFDIACLGHSHELNVSSNVYIRMDKQGHLTNSKRYFCHTGSYLNSYQEGTFNYSEVKAYPPLKTGSVKIMFNVTRDNAIDIHASE